MHFLDFISSPPKVFIFEKEANKTNLGGVFFFIYLLILIIISIFYLNRYINADKYTFSSNTIEEIVMTEEEVNNRKNSLDYNPAYDFSFDLSNVQNQNLSSDYFIYDNIEDQLVERNKYYKKNVDNIVLEVFYNCNPKNCCSINESDLFPTIISYNFRMEYKGPILDHYDKYPINNVVDKFNNKSVIYNR